MPTAYDSENSDEQLAAAHLAGDGFAFAELVERHTKGVYSFALRLTGSEHSAEDITQESFVKAWRSMRQYRPETSRFKTWLLRITRNTAIDFLRKRRQIPFSQFDTAEGQNILSETIPDEGALPDELFARAESQAMLERALAKLSASAREILTLHYTNGLTFSEIGEILNEPQNTVKSRHHRALLALRKLVENPY